MNHDITFLGRACASQLHHVRLKGNTSDDNLRIAPPPAPSGALFASQGTEQGTRFVTTVRLIVASCGVNPWKGCWKFGQVH